MSWVSTRRLQYFYNKIKENYYNETEVDTKVDGLNSSISSEAAARQDADIALQNTIINNIQTAIKTAIDEELSAKQAADTTL